MREIEFRAWLKDQKLMRYNVSIHAGQIFTGYCWIPLDKNIELMQYTGKKDKNNVEIFEGDIVKLWKEKSDDYDSWFEPTRELKVINFKNGCFRFGCREFSSYNMCSYELEVLGNIYENKELLEVEDDEKEIHN